MSSLGDVIHTLPALSDAAYSVPGICFDWVVEEAFAEVPAWHPAVDTVIPVALRRWRRRPLRDFRGPEWRQARASLHRVRYDAVFDAQGLLKSAFITRLVRAPRYGMDRRSAREGLAAIAYDHRIPVSREMHAVERTRLLLSRALQYPPITAQGDYGLAVPGSPSRGDAQPTLMFCHGTAGAQKLWPERHWRELARRAIAGGYRVWLPWGDSYEQQRALAIAEGFAGVELLPRSNLVELAARFRQVEAVVAVDTGLGHLAAALDVPSVSLYGPTCSALVGTYGRQQVHLQSPLASARGQGPQAKMAAITPDVVWDAVRPLAQGKR